MGDSGSLLLGFSFAAADARRRPPGDTPADQTSSSIVAGAGPGAADSDSRHDAGDRLPRCCPAAAPSQGGRDHSSHRLVAIGLSERAAVACCGLLAATGRRCSACSRRLLQSELVRPAGRRHVPRWRWSIFAVYLAQVRVYDEPVGDMLVRSGKFTPLIVEFHAQAARWPKSCSTVCLVTIAYYSAYRLRFEGPDFKFAISEVRGIAADRFSAFR